MGAVDDQRDRPVGPDRHVDWSAETEDPAGFGLETSRAATGEPILAVSGEIDLYAAPELKAELLRLSGEPGQRIVVDMSQTTFVDSTVLGVLFVAAKRLQPPGELAIACADHNIRKVLAITLLERVVAIYDSVEDALAKRPPGTGLDSAAARSG